MTASTDPAWKHDGVCVGPANHHGALESVICVVKGYARMR